MPRRDARSARAKVPAPADLRVARLNVRGEPYLILSYPLARWELPDVLTAAERDVVRAMLEGSTRREIASARGTSERTVSNLLTRAFAKMDAQSKMEIAASLPRPRSE